MSSFIAPSPSSSSPLPPDVLAAPDAKRGHARRQGGVSVPKVPRVLRRGLLTTFAIKRHPSFTSALFTPL